MKNDVFHSLLLIFTLFFSYVVHTSFFGKFQFQIIAATFVVYYLLRRTLLCRIDEKVQNVMDSAMYVFVITLAIESSGGLSSPFFFLYYFLLFALSLLLEPNISLVFSVGIIALYIVSSPWPLSLYPDLIPLLSLPFMTPFALILGGEYNRIVLQKKKIERLEIIKKTLERKSAESEVETHLFLTLIIKTHVTHALNEIQKLPSNPITDSIKKTLVRTRTLIDKFDNSAHSV